MIRLLDYGCEVDNTNEERVNNQIAKGVGSFFDCSLVHLLLLTVINSQSFTTDDITWPGQHRFVKLILTSLAMLYKVVDVRNTLFERQIPAMTCETSLSSKSTILVLTSTATLSIL